MNSKVQFPSDSELADEVQTEDCGGFSADTCTATVRCMGAEDTE